jgi:hypothetical protein
MKRLIRSTWAIPIILALLSLTGLVAALTGDGWRDVLSWIALGIPVLAIVWAMRVQRA